MGGALFRRGYRGGGAMSSSMTSRFVPGGDGGESSLHCKNGGVRVTPWCRNMWSCVSTMVLCLHHTIFLTPLNVTTTLPRCQTTAFTEYIYAEY